MKRSVKKVAVCATALAALAVGFMPAAGASTQAGTGACSGSVKGLAIAPWEETCEFLAPSGTGTLTLTIGSGSATATVTCAPIGSVTISESTPGTYTLNYFREGLCEMVASGSGTGSASAT